MAYVDYLRSTHWRKRRAAYLKKHRRCEICGRRASQVHHTNYSRLRRERDSDLKALCQPCHASQHPDKDMAGEGTLLPTPCPECGAADVVRMFAVTDRRFYRCERCQAGWSEERPNLRRKRRANRQKRASYADCRYCGGRWSREKHERLCVPSGAATAPSMR